MKYLKYLRYLLVHKWFVFVECVRLGIWWRGLVHDLSKFLPSEFFSYARHFSGTASLSERDRVRKGFELAWLVHQKRNRHHWQWWIMPRGGNRAIIFEMPDQYRKEMLADWRSFGRMKGDPADTRKWYLANKYEILLHERTRVWVDRELGI